MTILISEYYSDDKIKLSQVIKRDNGYRVVMHNVYFETVEEIYFDNLQNAEDHAENYVMENIQYD